MPSPPILDTLAKEIRDHLHLPEPHSFVLSNGIRLTIKPTKVLGLTRLSGNEWWSYEVILLFPRKYDIERILHRFKSKLSEFIIIDGVKSNGCYATNTSLVNRKNGLIVEMHTLETRSKFLFLPPKFWQQNRPSFEEYCQMVTATLAPVAHTFTIPDTCLTRYIS